MTTDKFYTEAINEGEDIEYYEFYYNEKCAFAEQGHPAVLTIKKYQNRYVISTDGDSEFIDCCTLPDEFYDETVYESYEEARQHCIELQANGIKSGKEQIAECISKTVYPDHIEIEPCRQIYSIDFNVFYKNCFLIEHMRGLDPDVINEAIEKYKKFCREYDIKIIGIHKEHREWNSSQRYYLMELYDNSGQRRSYRIHIPSAMQGMQRCTFDCIKKKQFELFLAEMNDYLNQ